jgi:hypothetical protein
MFVDASSVDDGGPGPDATTDDGGPGPDATISEGGPGSNDGGEDASTGDF